MARPSVAHEPHENARPVSPGAVLDAVGLSHTYGAVEVLSDVSVAFHAGRGPRHHRRERRRQVDPDEDPRRAPHADARNAAARRRERIAPRPGRCRAARHRARPSGDHARPRSDGRREHVPRPRVDAGRRRRRPRHERAARTRRCAVFGVDAPVDAPVARLSIAQRQLAQIARALTVPHRVVIFDEPTASLTPVEPAALLAVDRATSRPRASRCSTSRIAWKR